jgi:hypothetical protein
MTDWTADGAKGSDLDGAREQTAVDGPMHPMQSVVVQLEIETGRIFYLNRL